MLDVLKYKRDIKKTHERDIKKIQNATRSTSKITVISLETWSVSGNGIGTILEILKYGRSVEHIERSVEHMWRSTEKDTGTGIENMTWLTTRHIGSVQR